MDERTPPPDEWPDGSPAFAAGELEADLSDAALDAFLRATRAEFDDAAAAGDALGPGAAPISALPDPATAVQGGFGPMPCTVRPGTVLSDPEERPWSRQDLQVFLGAAGPAELAGLLDASGVRWAQSGCFTSEDVFELLQAGGMPQAVLDADLADVATHSDRHLLVRRADAAAALGVTERAAAELGRRAELELGPPMLVVLRWGHTVRVDATATRRMLDLEHGWLRWLLGTADAGARLEACVGLGHAGR